MSRTQEINAAMLKAANRLHHLSMRYSGAFVELVSGTPVGFLAREHPGLSECRDFIDLILFTRAEISALTKLCIDAGIFTSEQFAQQVTDDYEWLAQEKAKFLGVGVTDLGITLTK